MATDYEADAELMEAVNTAAIGMLGKVITGERHEDDPHHHRERVAIVEICRRAGVLEMLRAISADGVLRPPPPWPLADMVPLGGSPATATQPGFLNVEVRTNHATMGILRCPLRVVMEFGPTAKDSRKSAMEEAYDRGRWTLKRWVES